MYNCVCILTTLLTDSDWMTLNTGRNYNLIGFDKNIAYLISPEP